MKFYEHINDRGGNVVMKAIAGPKTKWASPLAAFEEAYRHEQKVTGLIHKLVDMAESAKDKAASIFLQWFVTEQIEEEASVDQIVQHLKKMKGAPHAIFMLDRELGKRGGPGGAED
jgi:ferritin